LPQGFVNERLIISADHLSAGFENSQGVVIHPDGNPGFTSLVCSLARAGMADTGLALEKSRLAFGIVAHSASAEVGWLFMLKCNDGWDRERAYKPRRNR
jgi:hypothetical protein